MIADLPNQHNTLTSTQNTAHSPLLTDPSVLSSNTASDLIKEAALRYQIEQIIQQNESQGIVTSVEITDMRTNRNLMEHNQATSHFAASINKLPIAMLLLQDLRADRVSMDDMLSWSAADVRGGYGIYDQPNAPTHATIHDLIFDMLNRSGNTAVRALVNKTSLGGAMAVNERLAQYPKLIQTRLQIVGSDKFYLGNTTAAESSWIMKQVQRTKDSYEQFMQQAMATNIFTDFGVRSQLAGNSYITLANKVGILDDPAGSGTNRHDTGIIYNSHTHHAYEYSLLTSNYANDSAPTVQAETSLKQIGGLILELAGDNPQAQIAQPKIGLPKPQAPQYHEERTLY